MEEGKFLENVRLTPSACQSKMFLECRFNVGSRSSKIATYYLEKRFSDQFATPYTEPLESVFFLKVQSVKLDIAALLCHVGSSVSDKRQ
jgi:hypothetical protein